MIEPDESAIPGLLYTRVLDGKGGAAVLPAERIEEWTAADGVLWLHVDISQKPARDWLTAESSIDDVAASALTVEETRPRAVPIDDGVLVVLRGVNTNPGDDPEDMVSIRIWLEPDRVISSRRRRLLSVQDVIKDLADGDGPATTGEILVALINRIADRIGDFVDTIEATVDDVEDEDVDRSIEERRRMLARARRQLASVRRFLSPQRDALDRLYRFPPEWLSPDEVELLREEADRITRHLEDLDLARERSVVIQEEFFEMIAQQQNNRMYVLSVVAAIFLPLTFITGLLGMNVGGLPGVDSSAGFLASVAIMIVATLALVVFFRWKRWL